VRADPASNITIAEHRAREAFVVEVMDLLTRVEALDTDLRGRIGAASGDEATRLRALQTRLVGGGGGRGGRGGGGRGGAAQPVRQRLSGLTNAFTGSGARTGTLAAPTGTMRTILAEAKADLASIERDIAARRRP
jgi:hypothetical protein